MAIYHYDGSQTTPKNYVGFRVAVSVNGKLRQKWYKKTETLPKAAKELEKLWIFEQQLHKDSKNRERKELVKNSAYVTGVAGIKMKFAVNINRRGNKVYRYYIPVFIVSGSTNGKRFAKRFNIKRFGFDMAWFKACQYAAEKYGPTLLDKMLKRKPSVKQFQIIYRWQTHCGKDIPFSSMPNELLE